jgi:transposase, IS5 family
MRRANKHHALSPALKELNRAIAHRRWSIETTCATWKRRIGFSAIRYIGLAKASGQVMMAAITFNMKRCCAIAP